ncbi:MAG: hypothetical protein LAO79_23275 [Acidobacteriia bacterium]|nr:hypothetical protein [Terriglobia bacterium]
MLLLLALIALPLAAADETKLQIVVMNQHGKPVDNAGIVVKFVEGRSVAKFGAKIRKEWNLKTNQEGVAKIPAIPQGKILIQVIAKNYQTFGNTFDVTEEEKTIEIKLNPPQAQYTAHPK